MKTQAEMFRTVAVQLFVERMKGVAERGSGPEEEHVAQRHAERALRESRVFMETYNVNIDDEEINS